MEKIVIVHLRRPRRNDPNDTRRDPFWEFGSFGTTGCHGKNLMHPKHAEELNGTRLAFAQGGKTGMKLVYLSPPIKTFAHQRVVEALWLPSNPFSYEHAPLLVDNMGRTDFPRLKQMIADTARNAWVSRFTSRYRARGRALPVEVAREMADRFDRYYSSVSTSMLAKTYEQALPFLPRKIDVHRKTTYKQLLKKVGKK